MKKPLAITFTLILVATYSSFAQDLKTHFASRIEKGQSPQIDGSLQDNIWTELHSPGGDFVQRLPDEGREPSSQTSFKILYDDKFLYIGLWCAEQNTSLINRRMSRRDGYNGDWVEVILDTYHDRRTASLSP